MNREAKEEGPGKHKSELPLHVSRPVRSIMSEWGNWVHGLDTSAGCLKLSGFSGTKLLVIVTQACVLFYVFFTLSASFMASALGKERCTVCN